MEIREIMTQPVQSIDNLSTVRRAAILMAEQGVGVLAVRVGGHLVGIVTDRDLVVRCMAKGKEPGVTTVGSIMTTHPVSVGPDDAIDWAMRLMAAHHVHRLPVLEDGHLVGIVSASDITRQYRDEGLVSDLARVLADPVPPGRERHPETRSA